MGLARKQNNYFESKYLKVVSLKEPLSIKIDGINGKGVVLKKKELNKAEPMNEEDSSGI